jgi:hypothetical protein
MKLFLDVPCDEDTSYFWDLCHSFVGLSFVQMHLFLFLFGSTLVSGF